MSCRSIGPLSPCTTRQRDSIRILAALDAIGIRIIFGSESRSNRKDSHSGWVLEHKPPSSLPGSWKRTRKFPIERQLLEEGIQSYCVVPLMLGGKCIGTLNIGSDAKDRYSDADAEFLLEVANQVALALGNMKSYQEIAALNTKVEHTAERYRTLLEINNAIITNLNQEALLHAISDALRRVIPVRPGCFHALHPERKKIPFPGDRRHCCLIALSSRAGVRP